MSRLYPLKFKAIYKEKIWGGQNLKKYLEKDIDTSKPIGESWEISDHFEDNSIILNGKLKGRSLSDVLREYARDLLGSKADARFLKRFPLLIKFIDANDKLSVQVHPDDKYAFENENGEFGKTEMWYIVHAEPGAKLIAGLKSGVTKEKFIELLNSGKLEDGLNYVEVKTGDAIYIPSGRVHAIMTGIVLNEIQQNSDVTYRVYDWGRVGLDGKPRELHVDKSLDVINFNDYNVEKLKFEAENIGENKKYKIVSSEFFKVEKYEINNEIMFKNSGESFMSFSVIEGTGAVKWGGEEISINKGESFLLPASLAEFVIKAENQLVLIKAEM